ncbi:MAG: hypothetical protein AB4050_09980 [Synechococcus sp.]
MASDLWICSKNGCWLRDRQLFQTSAYLRDRGFSLDLEVPYWLMLQ